MENNTFRYSYSSSFQEELQDIKKKYAGQPEDQQEDQLELLRKLDKSSTRKSTIVSIAMGAAGCLTMGIGMCCTMVWAAAMFLPGIIIGVAGHSHDGRRLSCLCPYHQKRKGQDSPSGA